MNNVVISFKHVIHGNCVVLNKVENIALINLLDEPQKSNKAYCITYNFSEFYNSRISQDSFFNDLKVAVNYFNTYLNFKK